MHFANTGTNQITEDDEIQRHGDHGRDQRLDPDAHKAVNFFRPDTFQRHPVKMRHACSPLLSWTSETNSSSSRLALFRILNTCTPCALSCENTLLIPCSRRTSTSSVDVSTRRYW